MPRTYRVEITVRDPALDNEGRAVLHDLADYGLDGITGARTVRVFAFAGDFDTRQAEMIAREFLADPVIEMFMVNNPVVPARGDSEITLEITRRPGVMDPAEASVRKGISELGLTADWVRTAKKYVISGEIDRKQLKEAALRILANDVIEKVSINKTPKAGLVKAEPCKAERTEIAIAELDDAALDELSTSKQLYLSVTEMKTIQAYYSELGRSPTEIELETLAQTWSEHCVHKTFRGKIRYRDGDQEELIDNLLKSTVAKVTHELDKEWCWSVFVDNAGVIDFDGEYGAVFKVETHNHPSAIEPYGGAGTGIGGVIRDPLGTGLGAKPVLNTDVFCFGEPDLPREQVPRGSLHPKRVLKGVVSGVRDYGNRMGIPTANGALYFDNRYIGNPLVFCGNVAIVPKDMAKKRKPSPGQLAVVFGGRTGRDGIHGATFSSVELDEDSEMVSSGAVQIGNPIEEKKVLDFLLRARDAGLYSCVTDCGAGGLSSAVGEMGESCGAVVDLEKIPLKYDGLSYTEAWISEAQERMVIAIDKKKLKALQQLAAEENVEATVIGRFADDRKLRLHYDGAEVGCLDMEFLHEGIPQIEREAVWVAPEHPEPKIPEKEDFGEDLKDILRCWNVCSKEWVIRQYDHEVQGASVVKPLVGVDHDGPGNAAVITPRLGSKRALVIANGMNPKYSDIDPYDMAANAIDEALRNIVATGGSLKRCAILDNFCWGNCDKPDRLAGMVRAAKACYDVGKAYGVPFISGKDSLNNEFTAGDKTVAIPGTLLISAMSVIEDCTKAVTMDAKAAGDIIYAVGMTRKELGGSHYYAVNGGIGSAVPVVDTAIGLKVFSALAEVTDKQLARAIHDCSEGGFAVAAAEMSFAGGMGIDIDIEFAPHSEDAASAETLLFSESASRFLVEVKPGDTEQFEKVMKDHGAPAARTGVVTGTGRLFITNGTTPVIDEPIADLKAIWQAPLSL